MGGSVVGIVVVTKVVGADGVLLQAASATGKDNVAMRATNIVTFVLNPNDKPLNYHPLTHPLVPGKAALFPSLPRSISRRRRRG